jgi:2-oxoisovalerate dehydrogenase E2 component (dihydrolipoyl transacylase)
MAKTGTALVNLEVADAGDDEAAPTAAPAAAAPGAPLETPGGGARGLATPAVRRIAREQGISLSGVQGTGKDGRVTKEDLALAAAGGDGGSSGGGSGGGGGSSGGSGGSGGGSSGGMRAPRAAPAAAGDTTVPLRGLARSMAKAMAAAWAVPHFGFADEVNVDALVRARAALKPAAAARGVKVTYLPFLIKAASLALRGAPGLNAAVDAAGDALVLRGAHNVGVAVDTPRGLIVPVVHDVAALSVLDIAEELARLQALAAEGKLGEADLAGNTFT